MFLTTKQYNLFLNEAYDEETMCAQAIAFIMETNKLFVMMKCKKHGEWCQTCDQKKPGETKHPCQLWLDKYTLRFCSKLKGTKETRRLNAICNPGLTPVLEGDMLSQALLTTGTTDKIRIWAVELD